MSEKGFAEGGHNGIDFECLIGTENLSEKAHVSGQQTYILNLFKNNHLCFSPANPFLDTYRMIGH